MDSHFEYYVFCLVALVIGFLLVKKIAGCLIRTVIMAIVAIVLAVVYYVYLK